MKRQQDEHHRDIEFEVGEWVWPHLLHRQTVSLAVRAHQKLARFYGPYQIREHIGSVAYRLRLPKDA